MLNLNKIFASTDKFITESKKTDICEFDNVCTTFADIRDTLRDAQTDAFTIIPIKDCITAYITFKDDEFQIAPENLKDNECTSLKNADSSLWKLPKQQKPYVNNTLKEIYNSLSELDSNLFENGKNYLKCVMTPPPDGLEKEYNNKFITVFPEVAQFDAGMNKMDSKCDNEAEILQTVRSCPCAVAIQKNQISILKKIESCRKKLEILSNKLEKMTDGFGWRCSLDQYINDKYSRYIVNAAMKHGIDVSRDSQFVKSLVKRLAEIAARGKPTRSDLATYAKGDKIDFKSDNCRAFLSDVEQNANNTNTEVLGPIKDFSDNLIKTISCIVAAFNLFDDSNDTKDIKRYMSLFETETALGRKDITNILKYCDHGPKTKIIGCNNKLYLMTTNFNSIMSIAKLFNI